MARPELTVGGFGRPYPDFVENGDGWTVEWHEGRCRVALLDGLGHGPAAAEASGRGCQALARRPELGPVEALRLCHEELRDTRGAAAAVALIDPAAGQLRYAGVGNIEARLWVDGSPRRPISYRGVVGLSMPTVRDFVFPLGVGWLLLLHSDGVSSRAEPEQLEEFARRDPAALARAIVERWGRSTDDATAVVIVPV